MIITDPIPWSLVPVDAQVLLRDGDVPRTVLNIVDTQIGCLAYLEGVEMPVNARLGDTVRMVIMDEAGALANLAAAGLNPEIIETKEQ